MRWLDETLGAARPTAAGATLSDDQRAALTFRAMVPAHTRHPDAHLEAIVRRVSRASVIVVPEPAPDVVAGFPRDVADVVIIIRATEGPRPGTSI